jgi:polar amino acid transport system substrate-binding protein
MARMASRATLAGITVTILCAAVVAGCSTARAPAADIPAAGSASASQRVTGPLSVPSASTVSGLAPQGRLRAAINFGNPLLANRDAAGQPAGVSVDLARELARRLGVPVELVTYDAAGKVVEGLKAGAWDVAFVAIDPARAVDIDYTAAYVVIEGAYLVRDGSPLTANEQVDRPGTRVVVGKGSAYDLFLSRELKHATIVRAPTSPQVVDEFVAQSLDVAAGVRQQLESDARRIPGLRLLPGRFMAINQAMGMPKGRDAALPWLRDFVEEMKSSGFVAQSLARHRIVGASIAPPAR